jgi:hypothetical protein
LAADGNYVIPGGGGATDANARAFSNGFGSSFTTALPAGYAPVDLALTDLDGDGRLDAAATRHGDVLGERHSAHREGRMKGKNEYMQELHASHARNDSATMA